MGNTVSQTNDPNKKSLEYVVNYITSQYIRSQNFKDMKDLSNLEYCDKLIILTSKIINKYLDESDVKYLSQKKGVLGEQMKREKILAIDRDNLDSYDVKDTVKKRRLCIGLARHYVQLQIYLQPLLQLLIQNITIKMILVICKWFLSKK